MEAGNPTKDDSSPIERFAILTATAFISINVWTGAPLLAVWVGSRVQGNQDLSMTGVFAVVVVLGIIEAILGKLLAMLSFRYDEITGRDPTEHRTSPWLRSMSGEREQDYRAKAGVSGVEKVLAISVALAIVALEIWFFFFAGSSIGGTSGR
jgi:hypothetical protein